MNGTLFMELGGTDLFQLSTLAYENRIFCTTLDELNINYSVNSLPNSIPNGITFLPAKQRIG
jgi:hypothetical protein